jgi:peptide/nickel transport system substrate-binding protein
VLVWCIFDPIISEDINGNLFPALAERWELSPDGMLFTFHLRNNAKWTDGAPIDAQDLRFHYEKVMDPDIASFARRWFAPVLEDFDTPDDYTFRMRLNRPAAPLIQQIARTRIAPRHIMEGLSAQEINEGELRMKAPVTSGPFKWVSIVPDTVIVTERNEDYYMPRGSNSYRYVPWLKRVEYHFWGDSNVNLIKMLNGERDAHVLTMTLPEYEQMKASPLLKVGVHTVSLRMEIGLNNQHPLFSDKRVRQAMAHAIDRETIVEEVMGPIAEVAYTWLEPTSWAMNPDVKQYEYNPEKAKQLLAEAGWTPGSDGILVKDGQRFEFEALSPSIAIGDPSQILQNYLAEVGIKMLLNPLDFTLMDAIRNEEDFAAGISNASWWVGPDRQPRYHSDMWPPNGNNYLRYSNPEWDRLSDEAWATIDPVELKELYGKQQQILAEDVPTIPIFYSKMVQGIANRLCGTEQGAIYFSQTTCKWWVTDATDPDQA